ncbi:MAG TPA: hypothetical protein VGO55_01200 [Allosphingosinicella sp.]|jgi:hypothetical protein|nr:hypothetical protein [Allosphingosinicella sp.]
MRGRIFLGGSGRDARPGPACNAEFRERFAAHLRGRLDAPRVRASYLFLAVRWSGSARPVSRLVSFEDCRPRPPVRWGTYYRPEIERWMRRTGEGRALRRAADDFWRDNAALLETPDRACPAALAR